MEVVHQSAETDAQPGSSHVGRCCRAGWAAADLEQVRVRPSRPLDPIYAMVVFDATPPVKDAPEGMEIQERPSERYLRWG